MKNLYGYKQMRLSSIITYWCFLPMNWLLKCNVVIFRIRRFCHFVVNLRYFDLFIMIVICASSFALATEEPVNEDAFRNKILNYFDYVFTIVFTVEMILKVCQTQVYRISGYFFVDICFAFYKITFNFPKIQRNRKCIWYCLKKTFYCLKWHVT